MAPEETPQGVESSPVRSVRRTLRRCRRTNCSARSSQGPAGAQGQVPVEQPRHEVPQGPQTLPMKVQVVASQR